MVLARIHILKLISVCHYDASRRRMGLTVRDLTTFKPEAMLSCPLPNELIGEVPVQRSVALSLPRNCEEKSPTLISRSPAPARIAAS